MAKKVVIVTGVTSGIGKALALRLARSGENVVLVARDAQRVAVNIIRVARDPEFEKVAGRFFHKAKAIEPAAYAHDRTAQQQSDRDNGK